MLVILKATTEALRNDGETQVCGWMDIDRASSVPLTTGASLVWSHDTGTLHGNMDLSVATVNGKDNAFLDKVVHKLNPADESLI